MEIGSIPFTAIAEYFKIYRLQDDFDEFAYIIRYMDNTFIELNENISKTEREKNGRNNPDAKNSNKR